MAATFGLVGHNAWQLSDQGINLVRQARAPKAVHLEAQPQRITLDIVRSVLVGVDMQNDFCHPKGWFGQKGIDVKPMRRPIPTIAALLPAWRAAGGTVLWLNWGVRPDRLNLPAAGQFTGRRSAGDVGYAEASRDPRGRSLVPGEWGARVVDDLTVAPGISPSARYRTPVSWATTQCC